MVYIETKDNLLTEKIIKDHVIHVFKSAFLSDPPLENKRYYVEFRLEEEEYDVVKKYLIFTYKKNYFSVLMSKKIEYHNHDHQWF